MKNCSVSKAIVFHHGGKLYIWPFLIQIDTFDKWLRLSAKSLLSKTEKTQISEQTQIIWVRWSLWTAPVFYINLSPWNDNLKAAFNIEELFSQKHLNWATYSSSNNLTIDTQHICITKWQRWFLNSLNLRNLKRFGKVSLSYNRYVMDFNVNHIERISL